MATYFVSASGSNTAPYDTWAKAATSLQTALTAASSGSDRVIIQYNAVPSVDAEVSADVTYTAAADVNVISARNDGGISYTPTEMGAANWIGNSSTFRSITWSGGFVIAVIGCHFRISGTTVDHFTAAGSDNQVFILKQSLITFDNVATGSDVRLGNTGAAGVNTSAIFEDVTIKFGNAGQGILVGGAVDMINVVISPAGSATDTLFKTSVQENGGVVKCIGCDFSHVTGTLVGVMSAASRSFVLAGCALGSGVVPFATQAINNQSAVELEMRDCASGDQHYHYNYYNALGSLVVETGIYANDGAKYDGTNGCAWKITTTALASRQNPFQTPWMSRYNTGTSAITPSIEILRDGSASAYTDEQVWGEWLVKATAGKTLMSVYSDRVAVGSAAASQAGGIGLSGWTGESGTAWSGKLSPASSITPAEIGDIAARVCVGAPSVTVYVDPTIRGV